MLASRIVPTILHRRGVSVKGRGFASWRSVGHVANQAMVHSARGVDELIILDIGATPDGTQPNAELVRSITEAAFIPVTVGGGVATLQDVRSLLLAGADKVSINTNAENLVPKVAERFGSQAVVASIDVLNGLVVTRCGTSPTAWEPAEYAIHMERLGAGEILLTCVERDGTMCGYDQDLIRLVAGCVGIPVIASGGCSGYEDMGLAIKAGASAVAVGALFQFEDATPKGAAEYLKEKGHEVRI
jgi:imidazole glycerol-phosphate synthase subunit HisF